MAAWGRWRRSLVRTLVEGDVAAGRSANAWRWANVSPGFGTWVYRHGDPRADACSARWRAPGLTDKLTREIPERIAEATGEFANIDYALAVLVRTLG